MSRRRRDVRKRRFVEPARQAELPLEALLFDATLLAIAGIRITVRNLIVVRALRDGVEYDEAWYISAVRLEFHAMAATKRAEAAQVADQSAVAARRPGRATGHSDYHWEDAHLLERRSQSLAALAHRLDELGDHEDAAREVVHDARVAALEDMAAAMVRHSSPSSELSDSERTSRVELVVQDLTELGRHRSQQ